MIPETPASPFHPSDSALLTDHRHPCDCVRLPRQVPAAPLAQLESENSD
jgi:hypothetical protein